MSTARPEQLPATPGQTIGPFYGYALPYDGGPDLVSPTHPDAVRLSGRVLDGAGEPVPDALLELWQLGPDGQVVKEEGSLRRAPDVDSGFTGWGRTATDPDGGYAFTTLVPDAPFLSLVVFARGLLDRLMTRVYLPERAEGDAFLATLDDARRATLVARAEQGGYAFDVRLQGDDETVFLDLALGPATLDR